MDMIELKTAIEEYTKMAEEGIKELRERLENLEGTASAKVWPSDGDKVFFLLGEGAGYVDTYNSKDLLHTKYLSQGNLFSTKGGADHEAAKRALLKKMRDAAKASGVVDWSDVNTDKYYIYYDNLELCWGFHAGKIMQDIGVVYFSNNEAAQAFIDEHKDELHLLLE